MRRLALAIMLCLSACAVAPKSAPQAAYDATAGFAVALKAANAYAAMPRCSATVAPPCSEQATIVRISGLATRANAAVMASQAIAKDPGASAVVKQHADATATDAVQSLTHAIPQ